MSDSDLHRGEPRPPALSGGLAEAVDRQRRAPEVDMDAMLARTSAELDADRGVRAWLRSRPTPVRALLMVLVVALVPLAYLVATPRPDLTVFPLGRFALDLALFIGPAAAALAIVGRPLHRPPLAPAVEPAVAMLVVVGAMAVASLPAAHALHAASLTGTGDDLARRALACFALGSAAAVPVLLWVRALMRDGRALLAPTAVAAALAGGIGNLAIYLHCPLVAPVHLWAGHVTILAPMLLLFTIARLRRN